MGLFSWDCYECKHPMLMPGATNRVNRWMNDCIVITRTGRMIEGDYDGYGRLDGEDIRPESPTWYDDLWRAKYLLRMVAKGAALADLPAGTEPHWMDKGGEKVSFCGKWNLKADIAKFVDKVDGAPEREDHSWDRLLAYHTACWIVAGKPKSRPSKKRQSPSSADQGHLFDEGTHDMPNPTMNGAKSGA